MIQATLLSSSCIFLGVLSILYGLDSLDIYNLILSTAIAVTAFVVITILND